MRFYSSCIFFACLFCACHSTPSTISDPAPKRVPLTRNPSSRYQTPEETMRSIHLPEGYHLQLVAAEPDIQEPVAIAWDGNGRLYVAEMRSYMKDINATGEQLPEGRITRFEDTDGDGKMDKHTVFADSLVLPRMIMTLDDRLVVNETYTYNLWSYRDTNGDGVADEKKLIYKNDAHDEANLEHQRSGLVWNIDNMIYTTRSPARFRFQNDQLVADTIYSTSGQWGLAHDDYGKLFFSSAGGETPALDFQQDPEYGRMGIDSELQNNFDAVWPIIATPDVEGGKIRLREDSTLNHFTASCGQTVFRGDALPQSLRGDLLICEPAGRLIRRAKVKVSDGITFLRNAYDSVEFMASTDMNFRPVNLDTGPDGCLYIVDMYHGIIQEGNWTREGSYLRPKILARQLDQHTGRGRIYRLVHDGFTPGAKPHLLDDDNATLIKYLSHPNGWWRDNAQKLLVIRNDRSVVPALKNLLSDNAGNVPAALGRLHALWTLDAFNAVDPALISKLLADSDPQIRKAALRIGEKFFEKNEAKIFWPAVENLLQDTSAIVRLQLALSLRHAPKEKALVTLDALASRYAGNELLTKAIRESRQEGDSTMRELRTATAGMDEDDKKLVFAGATIFSQVCATCHGADGMGLPSHIAPPLSGSPRVNADNKGVIIRILLHGLTGPVDGKDYPGTMLSLAANTDDYIAAAASYVRSAMGNHARAISPEDVQKVRKETEGRNKAWTVAELPALKK